MDAAADDALRDMEEELETGSDRAPKRRREEEELALPEMPDDAKFLIVEAIERGQQEIDPQEGGQMRAVAREWLAVYDRWIASRVAKMEHTHRHTLARIRLFTSPRWKLISEMAPRARDEIVRAYVPLLKTVSARPPEVLALFQHAESDPWKFGILNTVLDDGAPLRMRLDVFEDDRAPSMRAIDFSDAGITRGPVLLFHAFLVYGRVSDMIAKRSYDTYGSVDRILEAMRTVFFADDPADEKPTRAMLGWKNKIIVVRVREVLGTHRTSPEARVYYDARGTERVMRIDIDLSDKSLREVVEAAALQRGISRKGLRVEIKWIGGYVHVYSESEGYPPGANPDGLAIDVLESMYEDPSIRPLLANPEWGYEGKIAGVGSGAAENGVMIMPAPFFFYASFRRGRRALWLRGREWRYTDAQPRMFHLSSSTILAHQSQEIVFLSDAIRPEALETLALLQRRDILTRATAKLGGLLL